MSRSTRLFAPLACLLFGGSLLLGCSGQNPYQAAASSTTAAPAVATTADSVSIIPGGTDVTGNSLADNVFTPDANISSCVGTLERPDCGTKTKGGWHMTLVFTVLIGGLGFVFWRVGRGVRQRDAVVNRVADRVVNRVADAEPAPTAADDSTQPSRTPTSSD